MVGRLVHWLKPDTERRAAPREPGEGLTAFYWDGGIARAHRVRDISRRGAFIELSSVDWSTGTVMMVTLQIGPNVVEPDVPENSVSLGTQIVRTAADGMGVMFLLPDLDIRRKLFQFLTRWKQVSASANDTVPPSH